jgi:uncharacterized protein (DUF58 family)
MPTKRAFIFVSLALTLYLLANQTQVGWVYIMSNGLAGLLIVTFFYSLGMLNAVYIERTWHRLSDQPETRFFRKTGFLSDDETSLEPADFYEDDPIEVVLHVSQPNLKPAFLIAGREHCPFAPPAEQAQPFFVPSLFKGRAVDLAYQTRCDRRGLYTFSTVQLRSNGPFGLFSRQRTLPTPGQVLIYPTYHPLKRLRLLEHKGFSDRQASRAGLSGEVIGVREYRSGDSLRQIHWRSTARAGKPIVKEMSDSDQLTLTVVLDLSAGDNLGQGKFSTFETAIRLAASLGYYATAKDIPFYLAGQSPRWKPPDLALSWWGLLNYLARVQNDGQTPLAEVLTTLPPLPFVVALISHPDEATQRALASLRQKGAKALALFITPDGTTPTAALALNSEGVEIRSVNPNNWAAVFDTL